MNIKSLFRNELVHSVMKIKGWVYSCFRFSILQQGDFLAISTICSKKKDQVLILRDIKMDKLNNPDCNRNVFYG